MRLVLLALIAPVAAGAQIDLSTRRSVVDTIAAQVERLYVDADTGAKIATRVRDRARAGAYDTIVDPLRLGEALTRDLRAINGDLHLGVRYNAAAARGTPPSVLGFADRSQHYALGRLDVLPGNVGYMELTGFSGDAGARDIIVAALKYLEPTSAIIFDVRRNRGGSAGLVNFLISHFTGPDTLASLVVKNRGSARGFTRYTLPSVPGPRRTDVPVYVLTSRGTGSAGEDFAFVMKNLKRATVVGDRTAGAGHNVTNVPSGPGFVTGISITRVSDPRTGEEWERVGVQPDVKTDPASALEVAHKLALESLISNAQSPMRGQLVLVRDLVAARIAARVVPVARLASYAGEYEGGRQVTVANGALMYATSAGAMPERAVALDDSTFMLSTLSRITFEHDAQGQVRIRATLPDGSTTTFARRSGG
jgi:retinol-binding protein 3